jgi:hypothetical protein
VVRRTGTSFTDSRQRVFFDGAEPWKEIGDWQEKMNKAFIKWQHDNPAGGGTDGFMKALGLEN